MQRDRGAAQWDDLRYVLGVARARSMSGAAQKLKVDHTTVSRRIERLEQSLNTTLFVKSRDGYSPTPAGNRLIALAEQFESALLKCESEIAGGDTALAGRVRIAAPDGFGSIFLAPRLASLCANNPALKVELHPSQARFSLAEREVDILISLGKPASGRVAARKLTDYRIRLYAGRTFVAAYGMPANFDELAKLPVVGYVENLDASPPVDFLPLLPGNVRARFTSSNLLGQIEAVVAGQGVALLPDFIMSGNDAVVALPLDFYVEREFWLIVHEDNRNLARVQAIADHIHSEVRRARALFLGD